MGSPTGVFVLASLASMTELSVSALSNSAKENP
jgi:hypothetical protein